MRDEDGLCHAGLLASGYRRFENKSLDSRLDLVWYIIEGWETKSASRFRPHKPDG